MDFLDDMDMDFEYSLTDLISQGKAETIPAFKGINKHVLEKYGVRIILDPKTNQKTLFAFASDDNYYFFKDQRFAFNKSAKVFGNGLINKDFKELYICDNPFDAMILNQELGINTVSIFKDVQEIIDSYEMLDGKDVYYINTGKLSDVDDYLKLSGTSKTINLQKSVFETFQISKDISVVKDYIEGAKSPEGIKTADISSMVKNGLVKQRSYGYSTGIKQLDKITRGFGTDLIGIGAGTGCGKTTFTLQLIYEAIRQDRKCGVLMFEQDDEYETLLNIAGHFDKINYQYLFSSEIESMEYDYEFESKQEAIVEERSKVITPEEKDFIVENHLTPTVKNISNKLEIMSSENAEAGVAECLRMVRSLVIQKGCEVILLDHTTYLTDGVDNQNQAAQELMKGLKDIMHRHKITIIYITHLRKSKSSSDTHEEGARVKLDDFAGGKAVVQYATVILGLERDMHNEDEDIALITKLRLLKRRGMGVKPSESVIDMRYDLETNKLYPDSCVKPVSKYASVPF